MLHIAMLGNRKGTRELQFINTRILVLEQIHA